MSKQPDDPNKLRLLKAARTILPLAGIAIAIAAVIGLPPFSNESEPSRGIGADQAAMNDEKPFFSIDEDAVGPLTLSELQINIPAELDSELTPQSRTCFLRQIGELAAAVGDPETLDPSEVAYLPTDGSWNDLTAFNKRVILAQAIVSRAITFC